MKVHRKHAIGWSIENLRFKTPVLMQYVQYHTLLLFSAALTQLFFKPTVYWGFHHKRTSAHKWTGSLTELKNSPVFSCFPRTAILRLAWAPRWTWRPPGLIMQLRMPQLLRLHTDYSPFKKATTLVHFLPEFLPQKYKIWQNWGTPWEQLKKFCEPEISGGPLFLEEVLPQLA